MEKNIKKIDPKLRWPESERFRMIEKSAFYPDSERVYQYGYYDGYQRRSDMIKDIAIAFAEWKENLSESDLEKWSESESGSFTVGRKTNEDLFTDFIQTYYSPTPEV